MWDAVSFYYFTEARDTRKFIKRATLLVSAREVEGTARLT
jgi:hypothetical protein